MSTLWLKSPWLWLNFALLALVAFLLIRPKGLPESEVLRQAKILGVSPVRIPAMDPHPFAADGLVPLVTAGSDTILHSPAKVVRSIDGDIYAHDLKSFRIFQLTADGKYLRSYGRYGGGPGEFVMPVDFAVDANKRVFVADYYGTGQVSRFGPDGSFESLFSLPEGSRPFKIASLPESQVVLVRGQGNPERKVYEMIAEIYSSEGDLKRELYRYELVIRDDIRQTTAHVVATENRIFLAFSLEYYILIFDHSGELLEVMEREMKPIVLPDFMREIELKRIAAVQQKRDWNMYPPKYARHVIDHMTWDPVKKDLLVFTAEGLRDVETHEQILTQAETLHMDVYRGNRLVTHAAFENPGVFQFFLTKFNDHFVGPVVFNDERYTDHGGQLLSFRLRHNH